ncbi:hypothetical protein pb186bvf_009713 [Paramecium bursaria]
MAFPESVNNTSIHRPSYRPPTNKAKIPSLLNKPTNMEWEKLYEEQLQMKSIVNQLRDENIKLKTRNVNLEVSIDYFKKDLQKCTDIINQMEQTGVMKRFYSKPSTDNNMILQLKTQVKQLRQDLQDREDELLGMKKSSKHTKFVELEIEKKSFQDETVRLKSYIDELVQQNMYAQQQEKDKQNMEQLIQQRDNLIRNMQSDLEQYAAENQSQQDKIHQIVQAYQDMERQFSKLDIESKTKNNQLIKQVQQLKVELKRQQEQNDVLIKQKQQQQPLNAQKQQSYLKKPAQQTKQPYQSPGKNLDKSLQNQPVTQKPQSAQKRVQSAKPIYNSIEKAVMMADLDEVIQEIKYRLISENIPSNKIDQLLFQDKSQKSTIQQLQDKLQQAPFYIEKDQSLLMARYLVEKSDQQYPYQHNPQLSLDNSLIRGLFLKTIGYWACYDQVEEKVIQLSLAKIFEGQYQKIQKLQNKTYSKQEFIDEVNNLLVHTKKSIRELEMQYLISKVITNSSGLQKLKGQEFVFVIKEILKNAEKYQDITSQELQEHYLSQGDPKGFFFQKQQKNKQEQMLALFENEDQFKSSNDDNEMQYGKQSSYNKGKQGVIRSHSDPDPLQLQIMDDQEEEEYQEDQDHQKYEGQQDDDEVYFDQNQQNYDDDGDLNEAKLDNEEEEEDEDYNLQAEGVFDEDDEDYNEQWDQLENKGNFPIRQDRQIPNSRPTSSYVNKISKSESDVRGSLQSEINRVNEQESESENKEYVNEDFEEEEDDYQ